MEDKQIKKKEEKKQEKKTEEKKQEDKKEKQQRQELEEKRDIKNITEYVGENNKTFKEDDFNILDAAVLAKIVYLNLKDKVSVLEEEYQKETTIKDTYKQEYMDDIFEGIYLIDLISQLYNKVVLSKRFRDISLKYFKDVKSKVKGKQFAAVTCIWENIACLVFKGTDTSTAAWKENLEMLFEENIPSQTEALDYTNTVMKELKKDKKIDTIYLIGHSKGGNVAIYSALKMPEKEYMKISKVYAFDSPGFIDEIYNSEEYLSRKDKIEKIVPKDSVIGVLKDSRKEYRVVDSKAMVIYQHEILNWRVDSKKKDFIYLNENSRASKRVAKSIDEWLDQSTMKEKRDFVKAIYNVIKDEDNFEVSSAKEFIKRVQGVLVNYNKLEEEEKNDITKKIRELLGIFFKI